MAYRRYSPSCEWYVFEQPNGTLAVWHKDHRRSNPCFSIAAVREMVASRDLSRVPGFRPEHEALLVRAFTAWLAALEREG